MDRKIKERLIGLVVLLTLAVIFLPMFLGGPEESDERRRVPLATETEEALPETRLDLNDSDPAPSDDGEPASMSDPADEDGDEVTVTGLDESADDASPSDTAEPSEDSESSDTGSDVSETESSTPEPSPEAADEDRESAADESSDSDAVPTGSGWAAQVGSFTRRDNADDLVSLLRDQGFEAFLMRHQTDGQTFYRVRVGLESEREAAASLSERIHRETGHEATPVPHP